VTNTAKQKGTRWESAIVAYLREWWPHVERRTLGGANDKGDIAGLPGWVIEAKAEKSYRLAAYVAEGQREADNAGTPYWVVWIKRPGKTSAGDGYILTSPAVFVRLLRNAKW
jgi:hypothetical protein